MMPHSSKKKLHLRRPLRLNPHGISLRIRNRLNRGPFRVRNADRLHSNIIIYDEIVILFHLGGFEEQNSKTFFGIAPIVA